MLSALLRFLIFGVAFGELIVAFFYVRKQLDKLPASILQGNSLNHILVFAPKAGASAETQEAAKKSAEKLIKHKRFVSVGFAVRLCMCCNGCNGCGLGRAPASEEEKSLLMFNEATLFLTANLKPKYALYKLISIYGLNIAFVFQAALMGNGGVFS